MIWNRTWIRRSIYSNNALIAGGGPWDCIDGQGTISSVPAGSERSVVILGRDVAETVIFNGRKAGIQVDAGGENNAGTIECFYFIPSLQAPENGSDAAGGAIVLEWTEVAGAVDYRVVVSHNSDLSDPVINDTTDTTNFSPTGLSYRKTCYWQVCAIDAYANSGGGTDIWSFTSPANLPPVVKISSPAKGSTYTVDESIDFSGSANDSEGAVLSGESLIWTSGDDQIGTGEAFSMNLFGAGTHKITLAATDSEGATGTDVVVITVSSGRLPDTGQEQLEDYETLPGEDMTYIINPPAYTKLDSEGNVLDDGADAWAMVRDDVTGLIWEVKTNDGSIHDRDGMYVWQDVQAEFIGPLNESNFGGRSDWRLPTIKELSIIVNRGNNEPAMNSDYFPNTILSYPYWSASDFAYDMTQAWFLSFRYGDLGAHGKNNSSYYVRAVHGGQNDYDLVDNGDHTVTDKATGLMWQQDEVGTMNWEDALAYCEKLKLAGYDDWRLPNINELQSIVDYQKNEYPAVDTRFFPNAIANHYWSATTDSYSTGNALSIDFYNGDDHDNIGLNKSDSRAVRAVRGGQ